MPYGDPPPPKDTGNTLPPTGPVKTAAQMAAEAAAAGGKDTTADIRQWMRDQGIPLEMNLSDLYTLAEQVKALYAEADRLDASTSVGWSADQPDLGVVGNQARAFQQGGYGPDVPAGFAKRQQADALKAGLYSLAGSYFGSQGQTIVSRTLRPPTPSVAKLPTPDRKSVV